MRPLFMVLLLAVVLLPAAVARAEITTPDVEPQGVETLATDEQAASLAHHEPVAVPEPSTMALVGVGILSLIVRRRQVKMAQQVVEV